MNTWSNNTYILGSFGYISQQHSNICENPAILALFSSIHQPKMKNGGIIKVDGLKNSYGHNLPAHTSIFQFWQVLWTVFKFLSFWAGPSDQLQASIIGYSSACVGDTAAVGGLFFSLCSEDSAGLWISALGQAVRELQDKTSAHFWKSEIQGWASWLPNFKDTVR